VTAALAVGEILLPRTDAGAGLQALIVIASPQSLPSRSVVSVRWSRW